MEVEGRAEGEAQARVTAGEGGPPYPGTRTDNQPLFSLDTSILCLIEANIVESFNQTDIS